MTEPSLEQIIKVVEEFVNAQTWGECKMLIEARPDLLLSEVADRIFAYFIEQYRGNADVISILEGRRGLLARCRRDGVDETFSGYSHPADLQTLLHVIRSQFNSIDIPRRVEMCRAALRLVDRRTQPQQWATLQYLLASSLIQDAPGNHADNVEEAIGLFKQTFEVYTPEDFPEQWALAQYDLATAYHERIRGERAENLEQAIHHYGEALEVYQLQTFPEQWALIQSNLASAYRTRIRGERAENLEQAIEHYGQALKVRTREAFPQRWGLIQNNLGNVLNERIRGDRADNLEQAIHYYQQALEVRTHGTFPQQWALTQSNLASAYLKRIRDDRADNLEQAIHHYQQALEVYQRQTYPQQWALIQPNLAGAYSDRIRGEHADNVEEAIRLLKQVLEGITRQALPEQWAVMQHNLANAYHNRIRGDRAENMEQAIYHYQQALEERDLQSLPQDRALTQNNLASAYSDRIRGDRAENMEQAIYFYKQALEVYTRQAFPQDWAMSQSNLANAYSERLRGDRADNVEKAIRLFEQALEVYTRQASPRDWAMIQHNLARVYLQRSRGDRADNVEEAIRLFEQALEVYTRQALPEPWARVQHNLASALRDRMRGDHADNVERAIQNYKQALEVYTPMAFPQESRDTAYWLGRLLYEMRRYSEARDALVTAHQAVETLRGEALGEAAKRTLAEDNADLYARLVFCCLQEGDEIHAFQYAVAGKGRAFVDLLATVRVDLFSSSINDPDLAYDLQQARELRQQIDALMATLTGERSRSLTGSVSVKDGETSISTPESLDVLRVQLSTLQAQEVSHWDEMTYKYPTLIATQKSPALSVDQAHALAAELNATLVEYYRHAEGWCAFVVTYNTIHYIPLPLLDDGLLKRIAKWMLRLEHPIGRNKLSYTDLSEWHKAIITPLETYLPLGYPVVLAPFGALHVLPLSAARHPQTGRYVAEDYQLFFAPSLGALNTVWNQARRTDGERQAIPRRLLNVAYPGATGSDHYLPNVLLEADAIAKHFTEVTSLYEEEASPEAVLAHSHNHDAVHFGCHGWFNPMQAEQSGLMLAGGWLTVQRIITELRLEKTRLATLAACLSGRVALKKGDEYVGLLQAILTTGVQAVVASLWSVDDDATRALFETFYAVLVSGQSPAKALQDAARFIREQPGWEHPYYWAAFQVSGLAHESQNPGQVSLPLNQALRMHASMPAMTRGGKLMNVEEYIDGALILLAQMSEYPNKVLEVLKNEIERGAVLTALAALAEQAANVQSDADLQNLTNAIYRLLKSQPGLRSLLLSEEAEVAEEEEQRQVTLADYVDATEQLTYAQMYAPQIRNAVIECRMQLEAALCAAEQADSTPTEGKSHESSHQ